MMRRTGQLANRGTRAVIVAAALLVCADARAQSSSDGPLTFFDNIFTGSLSKGGQTAPPSQPPGASAQAQTAPAASSAPLPWTGEDSAFGPPLITASTTGPAPATFPHFSPPMCPAPPPPPPPQQYV